MHNSYFVCVPEAIMYLEPDEKSEVTDILLYGTEIKIINEEQNGFVFCKTDYGYSGYVEFSNLSAKERIVGEKCIVTSKFCHLYEYPEHRYNSVLTLPQGAVVYINRDDLDKDTSFLPVLHMGKTYFTDKVFLKEYKTQVLFDTQQKTRQKIVKTAMSYMGTPYLWGGKSPRGIDCSGLCFMAYNLCGIGLYRDAVPDGRYVRKIKFEELKMADLIYYNGHVVMYIGNQKYIHSSATLGGVTLGSFDKNSPVYYPKLSCDIVSCASSIAFERE